MKILKPLFIFAVLACSSLFAQKEFTGVATYKSMTKYDFKLDKSKIKSDLHAKLYEQLSKGHKQSYVLAFNKEESIFKTEAQLAAPKPQSGSLSISFVGGGEDGDVLYKNTKEGRYTNSNESYSKLFLIKDSLPKHNWKLENETKTIGTYTCFKATKTYTKKVRKNKSISFSINDTSDNKDGEKKEPEMVEKTFTVVAWYTPQIPVNSGPKKYYGLPGLILEVNSDNKTIVCSKIVLNPKEDIEIKEPEKGKKVTQKEFNDIMKKKSKELMEQFKSRRKSGSNSASFHMGG